MAAEAEAARLAAERATALRLRLSALLLWIKIF